MIQLIDFLAYFDWIMISRLLVAALLGGLVGFERERSGKVAGLRTHTLVSLGAALLSIISIKLFQIFPSVNGVVGFDYHLIANVVVGIGFIGAGTILRRDNRIEGTTTAASLWVVSAIGMASGFGFYQEATATAVVVYVVLTGLWLAEKYLTRDIRYKGQGIFGELKNSELNKDNSSEK